MSLYRDIKKSKVEGKKLIAVLIDTGLNDLSLLQEIVDKCLMAQVDIILLGGSLSHALHNRSIIQRIQSGSKTPTALFPGNSMQLDIEADALLLLSLISGRNPDYIIGRQVESAKLIQQSQIEVISTAYLLYETTHLTAVHYMTQTSGLPRNHQDISVSTALAAEQLGMKMIYLEAGSGAERPVPNSIIQAVSKEVKIPIVVGGGITNKEQAKSIFESGADVIVVGNAIEKNPDFVFDLMLVKKELCSKV